MFNRFSLIFLINDKILTENKLPTCYTSNSAIDDIVSYAPIYVLLKKTISRLEANNVNVTVKNIEHALCTWFTGMVSAERCLELIKLPDNGDYHSDVDYYSQYADCLYLDSNKDKLSQVTIRLLAILDGLKG